MSGHSVFEESFSEQVSLARFCFKIVGNCGFGCAERGTWAKNSPCIETTTITTSLKLFDLHC